MRRGCERPARSGLGRLAGALLGCLALANALALPGCAGTGAPDGLPGAEASLADVFGCWIELEGQGGKIAGEFLAVSADTVYVLAGSTLRAVGRDRIEKAKLVVFAPQLGAVSGWGTVGMISTLSHGAGLILSLPVWIITTVATHQAAKNQALARYPREAWEQLGRFARFPAGPPPALRALGLQAPPHLWPRQAVAPASRGL